MRIQEDGRNPLSYHDDESDDSDTDSDFLKELDKFGEMFENETRFQGFKRRRGKDLKEGISFFAILLISILAGVLTMFVIEVEAIGTLVSVGVFGGICLHLDKKKEKKDQMARDYLEAIGCPPEHLYPLEEATRRRILRSIPEHREEVIPEDTASVVDKAITIEEQRCINCDCLFPGSDSGWWECHVEPLPVLITDAIARNWKLDNCTRWIPADVLDR